MPRVIPIRSVSWTDEFPGEIADILEDQLGIQASPDTWYITRYDIPEERRQEVRDTIYTQAEDKEEAERFLRKLESAGWHMVVLVDCG